MDSLDKKVLSQEKLPEESLSQEILTKPRTSAEEASAESGVQAGQDFAALISIERSVRWPTAKKFWAEKKDQLNKLLAQSPNASAGSQASLFFSQCYKGGPVI